MYSVKGIGLTRRNRSNRQKTKKSKKTYMKAIITAIIAAIGISTVSADVYVNSYTKKNGSFVQGHYRSNPDGNFYNNWSTKGNVNPYTGSIGTRVSKPLSYGKSFSIPSPSLSIPSVNTYKSYPTYTLPKVSSGYSSFSTTPSYSFPSLNSYSSSIYSW